MLTSLELKHQKPGDELHYYRFKEVISLLKDKVKIQKEEMRQRLQDVMMIYNGDKNSVSLMSGPKAKELIKPLRISRDNIRNRT